jgi:hypothetical protein
MTNDVNIHFVIEMSFSFYIVYTRPTTYTKRKRERGVIIHDNLEADEKKEKCHYILFFCERKGQDLTKADAFHPSIQVKNTSTSLSLICLTNFDVFHLHLS